MPERENLNYSIEYSVVKQSFETYKKMSAFPLQVIVEIAVDKAIRVLCPGKFSVGLTKIKRDTNLLN